MNEGKNNEFSVSMKVSTITKAMVIGGIILVIMSKLPSKDFLANSVLGTLATEVAEVIGTALFSAGLVSVIVEISTIKSLVAHAFKKY